MGWLKKSEVHRCQQPEFDPSDVHDLDDFWQCDVPTCSALWRVMSRTTRGVNGPDQTGSYSWIRTDQEYL